MKRIYSVNMVTTVTATAELSIEAENEVEAVRLAIAVATRPPTLSQHQEPSIWRVQAVEASEIQVEHIEALT